MVDRVGQWDRSVHLSTSLVSNLVNEKVAPASDLTVTGLTLWLAAVDDELAERALDQKQSEAAAAVAAAAIAADAAAAAADDADEPMPPASQLGLLPPRQSERPRKPSARAAAAAKESGAGAGVAVVGDG